MTRQAQMRAEDKIMSAKIGKRIRLLRTTVGMSQEKLGEALNLTFQQIQKYEKGTNRVSVPILIRICNAIGCQPSDVLSAIQDENGATLPESLKVAGELDELRARTKRAIAILRGKDDTTD